MRLHVIDASKLAVTIIIRQLSYERPHVAQRHHAVQPHAISMRGTMISCHHMQLISIALNNCDPINCMPHCMKQLQQYSFRYIDLVEWCSFCTRICMHSALGCWHKNLRPKASTDDCGCKGSETT